MRVSRLKIAVSLALVAALCGSAIPVFAAADDGSKSEHPAKPVVAKVDAPAPLTERERWLLDRVEQLEQRVANLESKGKTSESPAAEASAAQPAALPPPTSPSATPPAR